MPTLARLLSALACLPALQAAPLRGQVNIERLRGDMPDGWHGQSSLAFTWREGNVRILKLEPAGRLDRTGDRTWSFLIVRGDLAYQNGRRYSNAGLAHARVGLRGEDRLSPEGFVQSNYDRSQRLLWRAIAGAGLRATIASRDGGGVWAGTALMAEHERLDLEPGAAHPGESDKLRWSSYLSARAAAPGGAALAATVYAQPDLRDFGDARVLLESTIAAPLSSRLSLTLSLWTRLDTRPPDAVRRWDAELKSGIALSF
jgi:hypothetical protein